MSSNLIEQVAAELRSSAAGLYPEHGEVRNVRLVGHTPKANHYIYDLVIDFARGSARVTAKIYRPGLAGAESARSRARSELESLSSVHRIFQKKKLLGVPRPLGDFSSWGAVVAEKFAGVPLQSIIMKTALLPGFDDCGGLALAARQSGAWLRSFHRATADMPSPISAERLLAELEQACSACRKEGLGEADIQAIMAGARHALQRGRRSLGCSAVLNAFTPLQVIVGETGVGMCDFSKMSAHGSSFSDVATFLAAVETLEKYPFCNRRLTTAVQDGFTAAYGVTASDMALLRVLKMRTLLAMFAQGRGVKESPVRKKVMWATVMRRFIHRAAQRSLVPAA